MKYSTMPNKNKGVVLILVLAFLTMFAMMVMAFLVITTNMSDSAVNSLAHYEKGKTVSEQADNDIQMGIKTLITGSSSHSSPIGPFSILENLYGEQTTAEGFDRLALKYYSMRGVDYDENNVPASVSIELDLQLEVDELFKEDGALEIYYEHTIDELRQKSLSSNVNQSYFENMIGKINDFLSEENWQKEKEKYAEDLGNLILENSYSVSFGTLTAPSTASPNYIRACRLFNEIVSGSSAVIYKSVPQRDSDSSPYISHVSLRVAATDELKKFFTQITNEGYADVFPYFGNLRLTPKPFSGTGAGGFDPNESLDGQLYTDSERKSLLPEEEETQPQKYFRLPYVFWGNSAAPDMTPFFDLNGNISFQTFWHHISDRKSCPYAVSSGSKDTVLPLYNSNWDFLPETDLSLHNTVRLNPGYTAADSRNLFLGKVDEDDKQKVVPSFVRPESLSQMRLVMENLQLQSNTQDWLPVLRKMTPRPLPIDHWRWFGGNTSLPQFSINNGGVLWDYESERELVGASVKQIALDMGQSGNQWDVDNDNDGVKEGIWIPSGLPIRTDENGVPYATMYSFTVFDMDGRVNVNTAGNWNQLPFGNPNPKEAAETPVEKYYASLESLLNLDTLFNPKNAGAQLDRGDPWYNFEKLEGGLGWMDDADSPIVTILGRRGTGLGPAGVDLAAAVVTMDDLNRWQISGEGVSVASQILAARYGSPSYGSATVQRNDTNLFDGLLDSWYGLTLRIPLKQPSAQQGDFTSSEGGTSWVWNTNSVPDDSDAHRRFFLHTDPIYTGDPSKPNADPNQFIFPWRGKTRIADYGSAKNPKACFSYPTFDFCDTVLRTYDPLGNDILTFMPQFSENPYLVDPYASTEKDSTFTVEMLDTLLRPFDYDQKRQDTTLLGRLTAFVNIYHNPSEADEYKKIRSDITTISSDIPVPSQAIPVGITEAQDGVYGIKELIRRSVILEIYKANRETFGETYIDGLRSDFVKEYSMSLAAEEGEREFRRYVRERIIGEITGPDFISGEMNIVDRIADQLFALLPEDIQEGRRLDLNMLSHKACWLDTRYEESHYTDENNRDQVTYVKTDLSDEERELQHDLGLVERMKFARGLYVLLMTLTYEDRNAELVAQFYDSDPANRLTEEDSYRNYLEGYDKEFIDGLKAKEGSGETDDDVKERYSSELIANRIAQYCVNLVDFTDPDATMTPFFYDPNPFDGWWSYRDPNADWIEGRQVTNDAGETKGNDDLFFVLFTPTVDLADRELDFYDALVPLRDEDGNLTPAESYFTTPDKEVSNGSLFHLVVNSGIKDGSGTRVEFLCAGDTYAQAVVAWLNGQSSVKTKIGGDDFGFRVVWGMERPDLLLTETLSFHDHGIADTDLEEEGHRGNKIDSGKDSDCDQVRRPLGSSYLELYSSANPNIPQSPELYQFDKDRNLWKLDLSKMTPRQANDSPYHGKEFPIWRVAISASTDPRGNEEKDKEFTYNTKADKTGDNVTQKRTIRKKGNSVAERLLDDSDWRTFSFRTRQFCDLICDLNTSKQADPGIDPRWRGYDYTAANILGPCAAKGTKNGEADFANEVEIDRILWFGWPTVSGSSDYELIAGYPDASHIFSRVKETAGDDLKTFIFPNQYLVVAPAEKRWIGSKYQFGSYFGVPSDKKIVMSNLRDSKSGKYTNSDYILAGSYYGLDINSDAKYEVNKRGFNISEPLWTSGSDPYPTTIPTRDLEINGEKITITDPDNPDDEHKSLKSVPDHPFDLYESDHSKDYAPIIADNWLGSGVIPGYRRAFLQRVADPNRPYHPCSNPYITVDWNMMDLAVFSGEAIDMAYAGSDTRFDANSKEEEIDAQNRILLKESSFMKSSGKGNNCLKFDPYAGNEDSLFSSRCWLSRDQKGFYPEKLQDEIRPNPWGRALDKEALQKDNNAGLRGGDKDTGSGEDIKKYLSDLYDPSFLTGNTEDSEDGDKSVIKIFPRHSLGAYNTPEQRVTEVDSQFASASSPDDLRKLYYGSPSKEDSKSEYQPFEYLPWNDAPFSSPAELLLVPASAPGRFGLEFVRNQDMKDSQDGDGFDLSVLYQDSEDSKKKSGRSLGSDGKTGKNFFGWEIKSSQTSPYFNFHHSSGKKGESLNLGSLFDYVTIPSLYMGTKTFCGYDKNGDPLYYSNEREPGKVNINTIRESAWNGILSRWQGDDKVSSFKTLSNRENYLNNGITSGDSVPHPFQSAQSTRLFPSFPNIDPNTGEEIEPQSFLPGDGTLLSKIGDKPLLDKPKDDVKKNNLYTATEELRKLSGLTTTRSNVFAVWMTVGYFKVERAKPGVNMPLYDPDGEPLVSELGEELNLDPASKYYEYYHAIYPDGYTYGKELGTEGIDEGGVNRPRAFFLIDRSIPVDFRRGRSWNWEDVILLERRL